VRGGAALTEAQKARIREINTEMSKLGTLFSQNVLAEVNDSAILVDTRAELAGMSDEQIAGAAEAAKARGMEGKYVIALLNTTGQPAQLRPCPARAFAFGGARGSRGGQHDNNAIVWC
jgi:peptidyl-dipeptidase Dcp